MDTLPSLDIQNDKVADDFEAYFAKIDNEKIVMPDVTGMPAMDAVSLLENLGLKVIFQGTGKVSGQSITAGQKIKTNQQVNLNIG
jgi:cell division protein FtsI (penicillin-binding protein 3)